MPPGRAAQAWRYRSGIDDPEARWAWIRRHPFWDEIELRLRHKWSPREVAKWLQEQHPDARTVSFKTLYRYLEDKDDEWFVTELVVSPQLRRGVSRLMVLQEHTQLILALKKRLQAALALEQSLSGLLMAEVRVNMELLGRLLTQHLKIQQQLGVAPVMPAAGKLEGLAAEDDAGDDRSFRAFVKSMLDLPPDQFGQALVLALGPPPDRTQPPKTEPPRVVIETTRADVTKSQGRPDPARPE
jgi:hypothetical protein